VAFSDFIQSVQANAMLTGISDRTQRQVSDNWQEKARISGVGGGETVACLFCNINPTRISEGSNPGLYHQNAANNHVVRGRAF
jgi:hypothetical protein